MLSHQIQKPKVLNDLSEDLRLKLENLEKLFTAFKQTNEPISKFFDQAKSSNIIYNIDAQTKVTAHSKNCRQTRDLVLDVMSKTLEITRDRLLEGLQRIRIKHINNVIQNKINILKRDIDDEMPKQIAKYKQAFDEYIKSKAVYEAALQANSDIEKKKILPPSNSSILKIFFFSKVNQNNLLFSREKIRVDSKNPRHLFANCKP